MGFFCFFGFLVFFPKGMKINVSSSDAGGKARQPAQPRLTHTHRGHQLGEVGRAGRGAPASPALRPLPGKGEHPSTPKPPATPFRGGTHTKRSKDSQQSPLSCSPGPSSGGSAPTMRVWQRRAEQGAPTLTHSHWRRQQQPLTSMFPCILAV